MQTNGIHRQCVSHQLADALAAEVRQQYAPGRKLPPLRALAKRFNVSPTTMSQALAILVREGLIYTRHGSGTYVSARRSQLPVGILIELDISHPRSSHYYLRVIQQLRRFFATREMRSRLYVGHYQPGSIASEPTCEEFLDDVAQHKLGGVVAVSTVPHPRWVETVRRDGVPLVGDYEAYEFFVGPDSAEMVRLGTNWLLEQGRKKIALLGYTPPDNAAPNPCLAAFRDVMRQHAVPVQEQWVGGNIPPSLPGAGWEEFREFWSAREEKPDGLMVCDEFLMHSTSTAVWELGIDVPDQLLVVTHATKGAALNAPFPVARVEYDPDAQAQAMGLMLLQLLQKEQVANPRLHLPHRLVAVQTQSTTQAR